MVFRDVLGGCVVGSFSDSVVPTFAADFRVFKQMLTHALSAGPMNTHMTGHLSGLGIHVPQPCIEIGFSAGASEPALGALRNFVGRRPITCAQGFSRSYSG